MSEPTNCSIWRVYNNGLIKNETHVLGPHYNGTQKCTGYNGDVEKWSTHNQVERFGCAQIMQLKDERPVILFHGYLSDERLQDMINEGKFNHVVL